MYYQPPLFIPQYYFDKHRGLASGVSMLGHAIGNSIIPIFRGLVDYYGWRGAMLINGGIVLQMIPFGSMFRTPNIPELRNVEENDCKTADNSHKPSAINSGEDVKNSDENTSRVKLFFSKTWNFALLRNPMFMQFLISIQLCFVGMDLMFKFSPIRAIAFGISTTKASVLPSIIGITSIVSRCLMSVMADRKCINRTVLWGVSALLEGLCSVASCFSWDFFSLATFTGLYGFFMGISVFFFIL